MYQPRSSRSKKEKNFSSRGKIEKYNNDGTETIIVMGRPFRVLMKIGDSSKSLKSRSSRNTSDGRSHVFLVENMENMREFPHRLVLRRSFYKVDEVLYAHREPEISARISDKGIARVFHCEVTRSEGTLGVTVAMEFFPSNLHRRLKQETRMTESEIVHVMFALASAVGYLHSQKPPIAHRDIRPENILINTNVAGAGAYRLCNFSRASTEGYQCENREEITAALDDLERLSQTPFRAPEMFDPGSGKRIDERVDLWSIGVLLYFMMFNRLPFLDSNLGSTGRLNLRIPMDSGHTGSLCVLLEHLLQPDPERRWDIFALTNYMRFDEDISRHLGTFFFTATEWPDGWEQQDVRVINRPQPPKAPPIRIDDGRTKSRKERKKTHSNDDNGYGNGAEAARHAQRRSGQQRSAPHGAGLDEAAEIAVALGLSVNSNDPEMIAYREQLIREQEEAWERAKAAASLSKKKDVESSGPPRERERVKTPPRKKETEAQPEVAATIVARLRPESETKPKPTKDIFDDLFDSTPVPTAPTESVISHSQANFPQGLQQQPQQQQLPIQPQQQQQQKRVENEGFMLSQELFGGMQPQQQPQQQPTFDLGGWSTGAPMEYGGAYQEPMPMASYQQQQLQPQQLQQLQPMQPQLMQPQPMQPQPMQPQLMQPQPMQPQPMQPQPMQPQPMQPQLMQPQPMQPQLMQPQPMQPHPMQPMQQQQQQQQQQQASMDFMQGNFPQAAPKREAPAAKPQHKDPFESLFY